MDAHGVPLLLLGTILDITERIQLFAEQAARANAEAARNRVAFLTSASARLALSLDYEETLKTVAEVTLPAPAYACNVISNTDGPTRVASAEGIDTAHLERPMKSCGEFRTGLSGSSQRGVHTVWRYRGAC
jgi:hypothetical protein